MKPKAFFCIDVGQAFDNPALSAILSQMLSDTHPFF